MYETYVTVQGNVATGMRSGESREGVPWASFRVACNERVKQNGEWRDGVTSYYEVVAFRALAENVAASLQLGQPVLVYGKQLIKQWERPEGGPKATDVRIEAISVGHNLAKGTSMYRKADRQRATHPTAGPAAEPTALAPAAEPTREDAA